MDLSSYWLEKIARSLVCDANTDLRKVDARRLVGVNAAPERAIVTIEALFGHHRISGTGVDSSWRLALLKSLSELGESILMIRKRLDTRCGVAGGVFRSAATERARQELLERDAFLWHYRGRRPFQSKGDVPNHPGLIAYALRAAAPNVAAVLVTDHSRAQGLAKCLIFGTACAETYAAAVEKAASEYFVLKYNHEVFPEFCAGTAHSGNLVDLHHAASRDPRNIDRFAWLCTSVATSSQRDTIDQEKWRETCLVSPVLGLRFVRAEHPALERLRFGEEEPDGPGLLHPFW